MLAFIIRRIFQSLFVMTVVAMLAFVMFNYVGDPVHQMVGIETSFEERERLREDLGLNDPSLVQFTRFAGNAMKGEFGMSYQHKRPVADLFKERLPATLELSLIAALFSLVVGVPMGVYAAVNQGRWPDHVVRVVGLIGYSVPVFWLGLVALLIFATWGCPSGCAGVWAAVVPFKWWLTGAAALVLGIVLALWYRLGWIRLAAVAALAVALVVIIGGDPWYAPQYAIPLLGMLLGNTMNGISLGMGR